MAAILFAAASTRLALDMDTTAWGLPQELPITGNLYVIMLLFVLGMGFLFGAGFSRPFWGCLAVLPAAAGVLAALGIYSLFFRAISILILCLGCAFIFSTLGQGLAFILFMDRAMVVDGRQAAAQIRSSGLMALLILVLAFGTLFWSGFVNLIQLGLFSALGLVCSYVCIQAFFPRVFAAGLQKGRLKTRLQGLVDRCSQTGRVSMAIVIGWGGGMFWAALPLFEQAFNSGEVSRLFLMMGGAIVLQLFFMFFDPILTAMALMPMLSAFVGILGGLRLLGRPLDTAAMVAATLIMVLGFEYSLFYISASQRRPEEDRAFFQVIRMTIFLSACAFLLIFGLFFGIGPSGLQTVGLCGLLGLGHCLAGIWVLLPPLVRHHFNKREAEPADSQVPPAVSARRRYRFMAAYPRLFAHFKLLTDPMFAELPDLLAKEGEVRFIIDIGSGYGVPGTWCLARFPKARVYGIEPDEERVCVAGRVMAERGTIILGRAPQVPITPEPADLALMLDMAHYLSDEEFKLTLQRIYQGLKPAGRLIMRAVIPPETRRSMLWRLEQIRVRLFHIPAYFRKTEQLRALLVQAGFQVETMAISGNNPEMFWFVGRTRIKGVE